MQGNHIGDNINAIRVDAGLSQVQLAEISGTSQTTISSWECGKTQPRQSNIEQILKALPYLTFDDIVSDEAGFAKRLLGQTGATEASTAPLFGSISAGQPLEMIPIEEHIDAPACVLRRYPDAFFLKVNGESMNRCLPNGCLVLIDPATTIDESADGGVFAVCVNDDEATIKRIHLLHNGIELLPDSTDPTYEPRILNFAHPDDTLRVLGKAVWFCSPLGFKL